MSLSKNAGVVVIPGEVWVDLLSDATSIRTSGGNRPAETFASIQGCGVTLDFSATVMNEVFLNLQMHHGIKPGSTIWPHVHWCPSSTNTGSCIWKLDYTVEAVGTGPFPPIVTLDVTTNGTGVINDHILSEFNIGIPNLTPSGIIMMRLWRDATVDTGTFVAKLLSFDIHVLMDRDGTTSRGPPWDT
jgi:hypothetical protein